MSYKLDLTGLVSMRCLPEETASSVRCIKSYKVAQHRSGCDMN